MYYAPEYDFVSNPVLTLATMSSSVSPLRIVSLVPSVTELVADLGLTQYIVGRTGFCIHPSQIMASIAKVGGTKDVNIDKIRALSPTHVLVNVDENKQSTVQQLGLQVVVTHPCTPADNLALIDQLVATFGPALAGDLAAAQVLRDKASHLQQQIKLRLAALHAVHAVQAQRKPTQVLYLIWRDPWMTVVLDTYISQMLSLIGWHTLPAVHGGDGVHTPGATRYPVLQGDESWLAQVQRVLLSSEPYSFKDEHVQQVQSWLPHASVQLVDAEMLSWYGSRAVQGLDYLAGLSAGASVGGAMAGAGAAPRVEAATGDAALAGLEGVAVSASPV